MFSNNKKMLDTNTSSRPLNMPEALFVEENPSGSPVAIKLKQRRKIIGVEDCWRIDDEWWRSEPVSRMYYAVILDSGRKMILSKNLIDNKWYQQSY